MGDSIGQWFLAYGSCDPSQKSMVISDHKSSLLVLFKWGFIETFFIHLLIAYVNFHTTVVKLSTNYRDHMAFNVNKTYHSLVKKKKKNKTNHIYRRHYDIINRRSK